MLPDSADELRAVLRTHGAITDPEYFATQGPQFEQKGSGGFINRNILRKMMVVLVVPFAFLLFVNGVAFAVKFLLSSLVFYFVAAAYFTAEMTTKPLWYDYAPERLTMRDLPDAWRGCYHDPKVHFGYNFECVTFESTECDGEFRLSGWLVPAKVGPDVPVREMGLVFTHGGGRDRRAWLRHLPIFHEAGYTCLLYDMREHGMSGGSGKGLAYGIKERFDVKAAAHYMKYRRGFKRIGCIGTSIGAAATISGAALPKSEIDLVIAENPMLTCSQLQNVLLHRIIGPLFRGTRFSRPIFSIYKKIASMFLNLRLGNVPSKKCQAMHTIGQLAPRPVLLMHGTYDEVVPAAHGQRLFDLAKEPKEFWLVPEGHHTCLYDLQPDEFKRRVLGFLERYGSRASVPQPLAASSASLVASAGSRVGSPTRASTSPTVQEGHSSSSSNATAKKKVAASFPTSPPGQSAVGGGGGVDASKPHSKAAGASAGGAANAATTPAAAAAAAAVAGAATGNNSNSNKQHKKNKKN